MIERPKSQWERDQERDRFAGCELLLATAIFAFLIGFVAGWVTNGVGM